MTWLLAMLCAAAAAAPPDLLVLDGTEAGFMHDALKRIACAFDHAASLEVSALARHHILVLCGKNVSADAKAVSAFLQDGGHVLAVGGGAKWMLEAKLFDATGYYPTGTTIHQSTFDGYHRLTFGYPTEKPQENWTAGVPMLLRATGGPLMRPGPRATSILGAGGPFSLAAFQRVGKGIALLIGPDPQGGGVYFSLDKATPRRGDELKTDRLLANALAWLREPDSNLIPNSGFEEQTDAAPEKSHWEIQLRNGASRAWRRDAAPEGKVFLVLQGAKANSTARVSTYRPIVVESGARFTLSFRCKATAAWRWEIASQIIPVAASADWQRHETALTIPDGVRYLSLIARLDGAGELALDDITLKWTDISGGKSKQP